MKRIFGATCAVLAFAALTPAQAWANPQHERMKRCNAEAKEQSLEGDVRKAFMSTCLRGKHEGSAAGLAGTAPGVASTTAGASGSTAGVSAAAPAPAAPAAAVAPAAAATVSGATAAVTVAPAADSMQTLSSEDKARQKACNRAATEQSLRGAKRKAFIGECMSG